MNSTLLVLLITLMMNDESRPSTIELRDGSTKKGIVTKIDRATVTLRTPEGSLELPVDQVMGLEFASTEPVVPANGKVLVALESDGLLVASEITTDDREATVTLSDNQPITLPIAGIRGILFGSASPTFFEQWKRTCGEPPPRDVLVASKGDEQAELDGTVGNIGAERIAFTAEGESIDVRRERVRAIYFAKNPQTVTSPITIHEVNGHRWPVQKVEWNDLGVTFSGDRIGSQLRQFSDIARIDYSSGRVAYLSDIEPEKVEYAPYLDTVWTLQRDRNTSNNPIRIGPNTFRKGLVLHSKTTVTYSLDGQYQLLQLTAGMEREAGPFGDALLQFIIDGKVAREVAITSPSAPLDLNLDLKNARQLTIVVDYGLRADLGDHVALGNARLLK